MDSVFLKQKSNLFSSEPAQKAFYCPTKPRILTTDEKKTCLSPARPPPPRDHQPPPPLGAPHWELGGPGGEGDLSGGSLRFNESWPSTESSMEQPSKEPGGEGEDSGGDGREGKRGEGPALSRLIHRFRHAPPKSRAEREPAEGTFWWREPHTVTPSPQHPQHHSTPTSSNSKAELSAVSPKVSSDDSLEERSRSLIEKSSSILSDSTASSLPAQKYFNSKKTPVLPGEGNPSRPGPPGVKLKHSFDPLRNLPLNPEDDILYQWRLRRRLELAREEAEAVGEEGRRFRRGRGSGWSRGLLHRGLEEQYSEGDGRGCDGVRESVRLQMAAEEENYHDCVRSQTVRLPQECGHVVPSSEPKRVEVHRVVPPVRHHAHLQRCCQATVPPHVHASCDVIPCPCCSTGSGHREESERAAVGEGAETRPIRQRRAGGKEGERRSGGGGSRRGGAPRGRDQLRDRRTGQEGEETAKSSEALHFEPHHTLKITGHGSYESQSSGMPGSMTAATLQPQPPDKESTYRSAPVRYPSPSVLTRHRSRTQHHARTARAARDDQQDYPGLKQPPPTTTSTVSTQSDPEAESLPGDSLHLSLSFSSEADQTLTPGRQATSCQGDGARETSASTGADPSITPVISKVVGQRLFDSPPPSPTPSPTHSPTHLRGTPASKATLTQSSPAEICWEEDFGDELLRILIAKAKLFEDQLWEIDRLLSALPDD